VAKALLDCRWTILSISEVKRRTRSLAAQVARRAGRTYQAREGAWKTKESRMDERHFVRFSQRPVLTPNSAKLLVECWLLASEEPNGVLSGDVVTDLAWRLHRTANELVPALQELTDAGFIDVDYSNEEGDASEVLAERYSRVEKRREKKSKRASRKYSEAFEEVWKIHARGPKAKADDEYLAAVANGVTHDELIDKLSGCVAAELRPADNPPFKGQHLFRWLRDEGWQETFDLQTTDELPIAFNWFPPAPKELEEDK
jgi:hypothetical protein